MKKRLILNIPMEKYNYYYNEYNYKSYLRPDEDVNTSKVCTVIKFIYTVSLELNLTELLERMKQINLIKYVPIIASFNFGCTLYNDLYLQNLRHNIVGGCWKNIRGLGKIIIGGCIPIPRNFVPRGAHQSIIQSANSNVI